LEFVSKALVWWFVFGSLAGCTQGKGSADPPTRAGRWYATDLHAHTLHGSNDTDGLSDAASVDSMAAERGLSLVVITDHSNSAGSMGCESGDVEDCPNQGPEFPALEFVGAEYSRLAVGVEISPVASLETTSESRGHIGCVPTKSEGFADVVEPVTDRPVGTVTGGEGVGWCKGNGGFAIVNHPYALAPWIEFDWTSFEYDAIEVFNGGARFDAGDRDSLLAWACDVSEGRPVVPVGGSDTHTIATPTPPPGLLDQALGYPTTWVWSDNGDVDSLLRALTSGRTVVGDPNTRLDLVAFNGDIAVGPGESIEGRVQVRVEVETEASGTVLSVIDLADGVCVEDGRTVDGSVPVVEPIVLGQWPVEAGESFSETLEVSDGNQHRLVAWVLPSDLDANFQDGVAVTAPVFIR
jgi:hypothetical protein